MPSPQASGRKSSLPGVLLQDVIHREFNSSIKTAFKARNFLGSLYPRRPSEEKVTVFHEVTGP